jgi:hypothetical protein
MKANLEVLGSSQEEALHELSASASRPGEVPRHKKEDSIVVGFLGIHGTFREVKTSSGQLMHFYDLANVMNAGRV